MQSKRIHATFFAGSLASVLLILTGACGSTATVFNPAFLNTLYGGQVPVTPGPGAAFVLVRTVNETGQTAEFIVTIEQDVLVTDENGNYQIDDAGNFVTQPQRRTVNVRTGATGLATDQGVLFPCGESPVTVVGLGENLLPTDAAVFIGGEGAGGAAGFGVPVGDLNPLRLEVGNFNCGDTIIFRAYESSSVAGGVSVQVFLLPGAEQPSVFQGPDTFVNLAAYIQSQTQEEDQGGGDGP